MPRDGEAFLQHARGIREVDTRRNKPRGGGRNYEGHVVGMGQAEDEARHGGEEH